MLGWVRSSRINEICNVFSLWLGYCPTMVLLYEKLRVAYAPGVPGTFSRHQGLVIPACITTRAWRTCRDACRDSYLAVIFEFGGEKNIPGIPDACTTRNVIHLVRGRWTQTCKSFFQDSRNGGWNMKYCVHNLISYILARPPCPHVIHSRSFAV